MRIRCARPRAQKPATAYDSGNFPVYLCQGKLLCPGTGTLRDAGKGWSVFLSHVGRPTDLLRLMEPRAGGGVRSAPVPGRSKPRRRMTVGTCLTIYAGEVAVPGDGHAPGRWQGLVRVSFPQWPADGPAAAHGAVRSNAAAAQKIPKFCLEFNLVYNNYWIGSYLIGTVFNA